MYIKHNKPDHITWANLYSTAQKNYVYARIATQSIGQSFTLNHQMIELYVKSLLFYYFFREDIKGFKKIIRKYGHNTKDLINDYKDKIPAFSEIAGDVAKMEFISNMSKYYIRARFGELITITKPSDDVKILDEIFQLFTKNLYFETKVDSILFLSIPVGTEPFFVKSEILDFSQNNCKIFKNSIGNIKIKI